LCLFVDFYLANLRLMQNIENASIELEALWL